MSLDGIDLLSSVCLVAIFAMLGRLIWCDRLAQRTATARKP